MTEGHVIHHPLPFCSFIKSKFVPVVEVCYVEIHELIHPSKYLIHIFLYQSPTNMGAVITQMFPPRPASTEKNFPSLEGKVYIVTGGNAGVGFEIVKVLYSKGATVYIASRSLTKIAAAIEAIKSIHTEGSGHLTSLQVDLSDLSTIPSCVSAFLAQESRLDVLWNNAGISRTEGTSAQGLELMMGTNCVGPFLFTKLLLPILLRTAKISPKDDVRVVFASSGIIEIIGPPGGLSLAEQVPGSFSEDLNRNYSATKAGNWFLASELDKRTRKDGLVCVAQNPGQLRTEGWGKAGFWMRTLMKLFLYEPIMGAYTELWCGLSPQVTSADGGKFAIPWGRWHPSPRRDFVQSMRSKEEGGTGLAAEFWDWCEEKTKDFS